MEEIGSVGLDVWLAALAYGANGVYLLATPGVPGSVRAELGRQLGYVSAILAALGYRTGRVRIVEDSEALLALKCDDSSAAQPRQPPAGFAALSEKRSTISLALDHLYAHAPTKPPATELPDTIRKGQRLTTMTSFQSMKCRLRDVRYKTLNIGIGRSPVFRKLLDEKRTESTLFRGVTVRFKVDFFWNQ